MDLIKFYKELLPLVRLETNKHNYIVNDVKGMPFLINGKQAALPTRTNIEESIEVIDGKPEKVLELFNPLQESGIKGENESLLKYKLQMDASLNNNFAIIMEVLLGLLSIMKDVDVTDMGLVEIIDGISKYKKPQMKTLVDENTVKTFTALYMKTYIKNSSDYFLHTHLKRGGKIDGKKFNRIGVVTFPVYEKLCGIPSGGIVEGVKVRGKDVSTFKTIMEICFDSDEEEMTKGIQFGNKAKFSPGLLSVLEMYEFLSNRLNGLLDTVLTAEFDENDLEAARSLPLPHRLSTYVRYAEELDGEVGLVPVDNEKIAPVKDLVAKTAENNRINRSTLDEILGVATEPIKPSGSLSKEKSLDDILYGGRREPEPRREVRRDPYKEHYVEPVGRPSNNGLTAEEMLMIEQKRLNERKRSLGGHSVSHGVNPLDSLLGGGHMPQQTTGGWASNAGNNAGGVDMNNLTPLQRQQMIQLLSQQNNQQQATGGWGNVTVGNGGMDLSKSMSVGTSGGSMNAPGVFKVN